MVDLEKIAEQILDNPERGTALAVIYLSKTIDEKLNEFLTSQKVTQGILQDIHGQLSAKE